MTVSMTKEPPFLRSTPGGIGMPSVLLAIAFGMPWGIQALHHDDVPSPAPAIKPNSPPPHPPRPSIPHSNIFDTQSTLETDKIKWHPGSLLTQDRGTLAMARLSLASLINGSPRSPMR